MKIKIGLLLIPLLFIACRNQIVDDPLFQEQYYLHAKVNKKVLSHPYSFLNRTDTLLINPDILLNMPEIWKVTKGSKEIVTAFIDDGFFYQHEDLTGNLWNNKGETGLDEKGIEKSVNGIDDDKNGYIDDVVGYDFAFNDPDPDCYVFDGMSNDIIQPYWHGTTVVGVYGAVGDNGIGISGICPNTSIMLLKAGKQGVGMFDEDSVKVARIAEAIRYAVDNGARIISCSWYLPQQDNKYGQAVIESIGYAEEKGVLMVVCAGNYYKDLDNPENYVIPASLTNSNIINVGELDLQGEHYKYIVGEDTLGSNYGIKSVDVFCVGETPTLTNRYNYSAYCIGGGTSCATPVVSGICALMLSIDPELSCNEIREILISTSNKTPELMNSCVAGGYIQPLKAVNELITRKNIK